MFLKKHNWDIDIFLILINALFAPRVLLYLMFFSLRLSIFYDIDHFCCDIFLRNRCFWYFLFWDAIFNVLGLCVMNLISFFSKTYFTEKNCWLQRGSNSDCQSRRRARWPLDHVHGLPLKNGLRKIMGEGPWALGTA